MAQVLIFGRMPAQAPAGFDDFWRMYPRKTAKRVAAREWARLSPADRTAALAALPAHVQYWQARGTEAEYIPHPRTWLHQARWEDELPGTTAAERALDDTARRIAEGLRA